MADLLAYVGRRLIQLFIVIWVAGTVNFIVPRLIPGDPVASVLAKMATSGNAGAIDAAALKKVYDAKFGFDQPIYSQYANYWIDIVHGDLGVSVVNFPQPVTQKIASAIPWSVGLLGMATFIAFIIGTFAGALVAWPKSPRAVRILAPPFLLLSSVPYYLLAILLVSFFSVALKIFPPASGFSPTTIVGLNLESAADILNHAFLPGLSIVLGAIGFWSLGMRALMVNVLGEDYITFAESKGLPPRRVFLWYGARNALLPQVTNLAIALGSIFSGAVLVEAMFSYPGLGGVLFAAIAGKDYFVIQGIVLMLIVALAVSLLIVDLIYPLVDPRIRYQK